MQDIAESRPHEITDALYFAWQADGYITDFIRLADTKAGAVLAVLVGVVGIVIERLIAQSGFCPARRHPLEHHGALRYHRPVGSEFTLRRATLDDVEQLVRLRFEMQTELDDDEHHGVSPADLIDGNRDHFTKQLTGYHFAAIFAEADGRIIGTGGVVVYDVPPGRSNPSGAEGYIMSMYTVPEWRGRGVARRVLDHLIDHAYADGARRIWLRASRHGRPVFEKYGFEAPGHYMQTFLHRDER